MISKSKISLKESEVQNCNWTLIEATPEYRRYVGTGTHPVSGLPIEVLKTEYLADEKLQGINQDERNFNDGRRWTQGAGSDKGGNMPMVRVGRIPLNKLYADVVPRLADKDHLKWYLNREENQPFRTRRGKL